MSLIILEAEIIGVTILQNKINKPALVPPGVSLRAEEDV
jgi:hypothetical protein